MWSWPDIADAALAGMLAAAETLDAENSPYGLDSWDETELHRVLAEGFQAAGFGVLRELLYPGHPEDPPETADRERERCDLVLTERPGLLVFDALERSRTMKSAAGGLFEETAQLEAGELAPDEVTSDEVAWIEVKAIAQYAYRDGTPGPNGRYAGELVKGPKKDLRKLAKEAGVVYGASVVVLFAETPEVIEHDLSKAAHTWLDLGLELDGVVIRSGPMTDRVGNGAVGVLVASIRRDRSG